MGDRNLSEIGTERTTPDRPLTLNLSAEEREVLVTAITIAMDDPMFGDENEDELKNMLGKVVQEGGAAINDDAP